jgi:hypothetical protein
LHPFGDINSVRRTDSVETSLLGTILTTRLGQLIDHLRVYQKKSLWCVNDRDFNPKKHAEINTGLMAMILLTDPKMTD